MALTEEQDRRLGLAHAAYSLTPIDDRKRKLSAAVELVDVARNVEASFDDDTNAEVELVGLLQDIRSRCHGQTETRLQETIHWQIGVAAHAIMLAMDRDRREREIA